MFALNRVFFICLLFAVLNTSAHAKGMVDRIVVLKDQRTMQLLDGENLLYAFTVHLGSNPIGHKQTEADGRTPEGIYTVDWRKADEAYYRVIHISYPNENDQAQAKLKGIQTGSSIVIHGIPTWVPGWATGLYLSLNPDFTDGSIGLRNRDIDQVWDAVKNGTPIEIKP